MRASLVLLAAVSTLAAPKWFQLDGYNFDAYAQHFGKTYNESEMILRRGLFNRRLADIRTHNAGQHSWKKGVNQFTDRTDEERNAVMGYKKAVGYQRRFNSLGNALPFHADYVPELKAPSPLIKDASYFSWIRMGYLGGVPDQGSCGSCWAFASKVTLESRYAISTGSHRAVPTLSPQQLASCAPNPHQCGGTGGCEGSTPELAYDYVHSAGALGEEFSPYKSYKGALPSNYTCPQHPSGIAVTGYTRVPSNQLDATIRALASGPLAVAVFASPWMDYESGIFDGCDASANAMNLNHAVVLTGLGIEGNNEFWEIRNSWGPAWGEGGTIRLRREAVPKCFRDTAPGDGVDCLDPPPPPVVTVCGQCGVLYDAVFPTLPTRTH